MLSEVRRQPNAVEEPRYCVDRLRSGCVFPPQAAMRQRL